jgi:hypothetical protein
MYTLFMGNPNGEIELESPTLTRVGDYRDVESAVAAVRALPPYAACWIRMGSGRSAHWRYVHRNRYSYPALSGRGHTDDEMRLSIQIVE